MHNVVVRNPFGSVTSSVAVVTIQSVREGTVMEANFKDKQPLRSFAWAGSEKKTPIKTHDSVMAGAGRDGGAAWVMMADGSGFTNNMDQAWAHFRTDINLKASAASGIDTTNLNLYRMEVTVRTDGLKKTAGSHGACNHGLTSRFIRASASDLLDSNVTVYAKPNFAGLFVRAGEWMD